MGERGRLEKFAANTYAPLLTKKAIKALVVVVFGAIFVSACSSCDTRSTSSCVPCQCFLCRAMHDQRAPIIGVPHDCVGNCEALAHMLVDD